MIAAVILAAGESRRMGHPKALLPFPLPGGAETTFLEHLIGVFARSRARPIVVVLGHEAGRIAESVDLGETIRVVNARYREGMLSSIQVGLEAVEGKEVEGILVLPVDHPGVSPALVDRVIESFEERRSPVVLPVHEGRRGHPVLFSRGVFPELRRAPPTVGARQVVWDHQRDLLEVEVSDPGIHLDVDTPGNYRAFRERSS